MSIATTPIGTAPQAMIALFRRRSLWEMLIAPEDLLKRRTYNVTAMSFTPEEIVEAVRRHFPDLPVTYRPDSRQNIGTRHALGSDLCTVSD